MITFKKSAQTGSKQNIVLSAAQ